MTKMTKMLAKKLIGKVNLNGMLQSSGFEATGSPCRIPCKGVPWNRLNRIHLLETVYLKPSEDGSPAMKSNTAGSFRVIIGARTPTAVRIQNETASDSALKNKQTEQ